MSCFKLRCQKTLSDEKYFEMAREWIKKGKSAFEFRYTDDDGAFGKIDDNGLKKSYY